ncbi:hypothetical protein BGZ68_002311 [Mortierella alpina]|nr:hypothetical protein BGZ68_002311 [Mortierella alpina]
MFLKQALLLVAVAAPLISGEKLTCTRNDTQILKDAKHITASITDANNFCTMLTGYGVKPVAENEGCGEVYCYGEVKDDGHPMPEGYILSSNYLKTPDYVQITGCIDSSVWAQDPLDDGGQMDSHGWPFHCAGYKKFVSLLEPSTNTFCLRCCVEKENVHCNTITPPASTIPSRATPTTTPLVIPPKVTPPKVDPAKVKPPKVNPPKVKPPKGKPSKGKPSKGKPSKGKPAKGMPVKGKPSKVVRQPKITTPEIKQPKVYSTEAIEPMSNAQPAL